MKEYKSVQIAALKVVAICLLICTSCARPGYGPNSQPYNQSYNQPHSQSYNGGYYDPNYDRARYESRRDWNRQQRDEAARQEMYRERTRLEAQRRRLESERHTPARQSSSRFVCPPGTHLSTHRCTDQERKRGCKDYGGPNGQGCTNF
jgi:hypothetical protein